jgi:signal transduction histidine kinase
MEVKAPVHPDQRPLLAGIRRSVDAALAIIADLLDLARADSGGLTVNRVEIDLRAIAREAAEGHRPSAEAAGHRVEVDAPQEKLKLYTDPARVGQVLGNLLSNAIKYTPPPGRITVRCRIGGPGEAPAEGRWATIEVSDTGPGIPAGQREAIFDEFTRLEDGGEQAGHGLGLAIARRVARLLGGDLTVGDAPGGGASFVLWLPLREEATARPGPAPRGQPSTQLPR